RAPLPQLGVKGVVTWESAPPVRDALRTPWAPVFANYYVIGVDGIATGGLSASYLRQFAVLRSPGKPKWTVGASGGRELVRSSPICQFAFSRAAAPIGPDTGEVVFEMDLGEWMIETKFKPREMLYHGQLA